MPWVGLIPKPGIKPVQVVLYLLLAPTLIGSRAPGQIAHSKLGAT